MRFRVIERTIDEGLFGYYGPDYIEVIADWLTRAEAKTIYKHYDKVNHYDNVRIEVEVMYDGDWQNVSDGWGYTAMAEQEDWFDRKGLDYMWWLQFDEIRKLR